MEDRLYKDKYLIALYDKDDFLFLVASNVKELAELTNKKYDCIQSTLSHRIGKLIVDGVKYTIHLIPDEERNEL